ncbi:MAG: hypothetical protein OXC72_05650 [Roseovarius sp.]|nr:hypothetical protein [Roseovarius sp.]
MKARRALSKPIIHPGLSQSLGENINGPSIVERPDWAHGCGRYLLYFAHHHGRHIRLAWANSLYGPWHIHETGALQLQKTRFAQTPPDLPQPEWALKHGLDAHVPHIASPDVHVNHQNRQFEMLFHGLDGDGIQKTCMAVSRNGLEWNVGETLTEQTYLRRFDFGSRTYAIALHGELMQLRDDGAIEHGPRPLSKNTRHVAVMKNGETLDIVFSRIGDRPERLLHVRMAMNGNWLNWKCDGKPVELLRPELEWEGAGLPKTVSHPGPTGFSCALRDPYLFRENGRTWLIYAGGGESALGLAEII